MGHHISFCRSCRYGALALCPCLLALLMPSAALAQDEGKTVRVGWYDSSFNRVDAAGRRSGYGYEYQLKVAAYTGWQYVYVSGSWPELMQMLARGEIDLLSDVSFTPERVGRKASSSPVRVRPVTDDGAPGRVLCPPAEFGWYHGVRLRPSEAALFLPFQEGRNRWK